MSPKAELFKSILERLKAQVPELRYINQDLGQLENYGMRPAVAWPCCLIDIADSNYSEQNNEKVQVAAGSVIIRTGLVQYSDSSNLTDESIRNNALQYYELENKIYSSLHGWSPENMGRMLRRADGTEKRDDDIRVRVTRYEISYTDTSAMAVYTKVPRPGANIAAVTKP